MQTKSGLMLKILLNRYHGDPPKSLLKPFAHEEITELGKIESSLANPEQGLDQPKTLLQRIHYSWFIPVLETIPKNLLPLAVAALPKHQSEKIKQQLNLNPLERPLARLTRIFLLDRLYQLIKPTEILPLAFLPVTPLSGLFKLTKAQLVEIIDLLGIYDLADEVRYIIDKEQVNKINSCLTPRQKQFLRHSLHQKEKLTSTPLHLKQWDGDCKKLALLLHQRGLIRMSKALCGQHPHAIWHLMHILDKGRGEILKRHYTDTALPGVTAALIQQILTVMNFLK